MGSLRVTSDHHRCHLITIFLHQPACFRPAKRHASVFLALINTHILTQLQLERKLKNQHRIKKNKNKYYTFHALLSKCTIIHIIWNSNTGCFVRTIMIPEHYKSKDDGDESEFGLWKGHNDFAFTENMIIIIQHKRDFPIAADILLFW